MFHLKSRNNHKNMFDKRKKNLIQSILSVDKSDTACPVFSPSIVVGRVANTGPAVLVEFPSALVFFLIIRPDPV